MMCLSMTQIKQLILFFTNHVKKVNKGVSNIIDRIEFYDEDESMQILTEKSNKQYDMDHWLTNC